MPSVCAPCDHPAPCTLHPLALPSALGPEAQGGGGGADRHARHLAAALLPAGRAHVARCHWAAISFLAARLGALQHLQRRHPGGCAGGGSRAAADGGRAADAGGADAGAERSAGRRGRPAALVAPKVSERLHREHPRERRQSWRRAALRRSSCILLCICTPVLPLHPCSNFSVLTDMNSSKGSVIYWQRRCVQGKGGRSGRQAQHSGSCGAAPYRFCPRLLHGSAIPLARLAAFIMHKVKLSR